MVPNSNILPTTEEIIHQFNFKKIKWKKFNNNINKKLEEEATFTPNFIPNDKNLNNNEIDFYIKKLENIIQNSIKETVPKFKQITNYLEILDSKICSKLHSHKNILLRALYKMYRLNYNKNDYRIINIKSDRKSTRLNSSHC